MTDRIHSVTDAKKSEIYRKQISRSREVILWMDIDLKREVVILGHNGVIMELYWGHIGVIQDHIGGC